MNILRCAFAGAAMTLSVVSGALAADLPVKARSAQYLKICSQYGAGFFYIPDTDTCIKLGGFLRIDTTFNGNVYGLPAWSGDLGQGNRYFDYFVGRSRLGVTVDTRTDTPYGLLRAFGQFDLQFNNFSTANPTALTTTSFGTPFGLNSGLLSNAGGGYVPVDPVFIQFAGFTIGKSASAYATPWHGYPGNNTSYLMGGHDTVTGVNNIQYTAQFGNGVTGSVGLDDPTVFNRTVLFNLSTGTNAVGLGANAYAGTRAPDVVGRIRVDQAWGLVQFSVAAHEVAASYNALAFSASPTNSSETSGHPDAKWGGSAMAALQIKNIPTGANDDFKIEASYARGITKNVISTSTSSPSFAMFGGSSRAGAYQSIGFGATTDAVFLPAFAGGTGDLKLTTSYGLRGAFNHNWNPFWSSSLFGSASAVRYAGNASDITTAMGQYCTSYIASTGGLATKSADFRCNPNFNVYQAGFVTRWTPVKNLTFSGEVQFVALDQKFTGTSVLPAAAPKPATVYEYKNQNTAYLNVRVQRNF
ncbi:porin [Bradyrhizobium lablabi]|uniref:porin n=1 Tax=Bradyrhizobium lablabi TaxID=722472 RepID=UPI001BA7FA2D|nr:porin [Bradyrhizobium lablabi]MBR1121864.1 porin [Bradyrhizobium lablabi]